jgi:hypothetical protein
MSGQWEVVGKSKQKQSGQTAKKLSKSERKKFIENAPKVEDIRKFVLPLTTISLGIIIVFPSNHYQDMEL